MTDTQFIWKQILPISIFQLADEYVENLLETGKLDTQKLSTVTLGSQAVYIAGRVDINTIITKLENAIDNSQDLQNLDYKFYELLVANKQLRGYSKAYIANIITAIGNTDTSQEDLFEVLRENKFWTSPIEVLSFEDEDLQFCQDILNKECQDRNLDFELEYDLENVGSTQVLVRK